MEGLCNGQVWRQDGFPFHSRVVLWMWGDQWVLLSVPEIGSPGIPCTNQDGRMFYSRGEAHAHLVRNGYVLTDEHLEAAS